jgi:hypothetical protein
MRRVNAWRVAGVADPGYSCFDEWLRVAHASKRVSVKRTFSADVSCCVGPWALAPRLVLNTYWSAPLQSFADRGDKDFSPMRCAAMLKKENTLPRSELHFSVHNRDGLAGARKHRPDM